MCRLDPVFASVLMVNHDSHVLIGRKDATATLPFAQLLEELHVALAQVHGA